MHLSPHCLHAVGSRLVNRGLRGFIESSFRSRFIFKIKAHEKTPTLPPQNSNTIRKKLSFLEFLSNPFNIIQSFNDILLLRNDHVVNLSKGCNPLGAALNACKRSGWCFWVSTNLAENDEFCKMLTHDDQEKENDWGNSTELLRNFHGN